VLQIIYPLKGGRFEILSKKKSPTNGERFFINGSKYYFTEQ